MWENQSVAHTVMENITLEAEIRVTEYFVYKRRYLDKRLIWVFEINIYKTECVLILTVKKHNWYLKHMWFSK